MIAHELRKLQTSSKELRKFGLVVGGVLALVAGWLFWRGKPAAPYWLIPALPLLLLGAARPQILKWPYLVWMTLGIVLGASVSAVLLTLIYYVVLTPLGLVAKATGKDFMQRRFEPGAATYWIPRKHLQPRSPSQYERQF